MPNNTAAGASAAPEQKSILLLGGSRHQVPAIEVAKELGYRTVLCDYLPDNPGQYVADVFYQESTTDWDLMLKIAQAEQVSGVLAFGTDVAASTAAYVCEHMGLPTNPLASVEVLSEKHLFRDHLEKSGLPCPKHAALAVDATPAEAIASARGMELPVVLKPTDSSGSKGVTILEELDEPAVATALIYAAEYSRNKTLVLEEYIRSGFPRVIGGDVFVANGKVEFWGLMSCLRDKALGGLVPAGERWPSGLSDAQLNACKEQIQALVTSLDMQFGEMNVEIIVDDKGKPRFLELAARAGGNMIPNQLSDIAGINLIEANVRYAMGETMDVRFDGVSAEGAYSTYMLHASHAGTYCGISVAPELEPYVYRHTPYVEEGSQVASFDNASKALGVLFLRFDNVEHMEQVLDKIDELVTVQIEN